MKFSWPEKKISQIISYYDFKASIFYSETKFYWARLSQDVYFGDELISGIVHFSNFTFKQGKLTFETIISSYTVSLIESNEILELEIIDPGILFFLISFIYFLF
jgi:hypothetical protein